MMNMSLVQVRLVVLTSLLVGVLVIGAVTAVSVVTSDTNISHLTVHFLDVGQGDAIFIETPDGVQVLIDGGPDGSVVRELGSVMSPFDKTIDVIIETHNDKDHIGGLADVLDHYRVLSIMKTNNRSETGIADAVDAKIRAERAQLIEPQAGQRYILGASTTLTIFSPAGDVRQLGSNASSIVVQLEYGETKFFFTGDAPIGIEEYLVRAYGPHLKSDVLKLGHHGSRTSSSLLFLDAVSPTYAVISAGKNNSYGHPHPDAVENAIAVGSTILSTAEQGRVKFYSDGTRVWQE